MHTYIATDMYNNSSLWLNNLNNYCSQMKRKTKTKDFYSHYLIMSTIYAYIHKTLKKRLFHVRINRDRKRETQRERESEREKERERTAELLH